ncbi:MmpS family transport accessory protein [Micromonospora sp. URMC 103]|uniref:MmpS family transport accessory protein n=1 Tax=Micromonospora sp. URMC 103 TaxID=3423406 RepID=UPI003F1D8993
MLVGAVLAVVLLVAGGVGLDAYVTARPDHQARDEAAPDDEWPGRGTVGSVAATTPPAPSAAPATTPSTGPGRIRVVYEVTGQGRADILYWDANGEPVWLEGARLPWRKSIRTDRRDRVMVQAARMAATGGKKLSCTLSTDGGTPVTEAVDSTGWRASCFG